MRFEFDTWVRPKRKLKNEEEDINKEASKKKEKDGMDQKENKMKIERKNQEKKERRGRKKATERKLYKGEQTIERFLIKKEKERVSSLSTGSYARVLVVTGESLCYI